jgi:hypothetical protein
MLAVPGLRLAFRIHRCSLERNSAQCPMLKIAPRERPSPLPSFYPQEYPMRGRVRPNAMKAQDARYIHAGYAMRARDDDRVMCS